MDSIRRSLLDVLRPRLHCLTRIHRILLLNVTSPNSPTFPSLPPTPPLPHLTLVAVQANKFTTRPHLVRHRRHLLFFMIVIVPTRLSSLSLSLDSLFPVCTLLISLFYCHYQLMTKMTDENHYMVPQIRTVRLARIQTMLGTLQWSGFGRKCSHRIVHMR